MTIKVVHCKKEAHEYIGRPSVLGNKFTHKAGTKADIIVGTREEAVAEYKKWIKERITAKDEAILNELTRLKRIAMKGDLNLGCWCAPQACHGDVIKQILDYSISRTKAR